MLRGIICRCTVKWKNLVLVVLLTAVTLTLVKHHHKYVNLTSSSDLTLSEGNPRFPVNCTKIIKGDFEEIQDAKLHLLSVNFKSYRRRLTEEDYINMTKDCSSFTKERKYILYPLSKEERKFPIAYSIVVHHRIDMFEKLLRSIYMPQNSYCIHVDQKSSPSFLEAVKAIISCFNNVFIASQLESVIYASWTRVQADLNCMKDLHAQNLQWKYLLNLCGMDFPIKTNKEIVDMLKTLKGENSLETEKMPSHKEARWRKHHEIVDGALKKTETEKQPPPYNIPIFSGSAYFVLSREFVGQVLTNEKIKLFLDWSKDTYSPDEFMWATLLRMPEMPGFAPASSKYDVSDMNSIARFVKWNYLEGDVSKGATYPPCTGIHVRSVCVFGAGDLQFMLSKHHLFANKFDIDVDPFAVQCLEEHLRNKALHQESPI